VVEAFDVDLGLGTGKQGEHGGVGADGPLRAERPPRKVHRLAEVGRRCLKGQIGPQCLHDLLAMQAMARGERQQLDQVGSSPVAPRITGNGVAVHDHAERAE
jgi:hypothetical protein